MQRKKLKMGNRKAVSPVVATVLLIAMVIVIGLIIFLWFRSLTRTATDKFGKNIELSCEDIDFSASYSTTTQIFSAENLGNVPIYSFNLKVYQTGSYTTKDIKNLTSTWPAAGLKQGGVFSTTINFGSPTPSRILAVPVLIGTSRGVQKTHVCADRFGHELF